MTINKKMRIITEKITTGGGVFGQKIFLICMGNVFY